MQLELESGSSAAFLSSVTLPLRQWCLLNLELTGRTVRVLAIIKSLRRVCYGVLFNAMLMIVTVGENHVCVFGWTWTARCHLAGIRVSRSERRVRFISHNAST